MGSHQPCQPLESEADVADGLAAISALYDPHALHAPQPLSRPRRAPVPLLPAQIRPVVTPIPVTLNPEDLKVIIPANPKLNLKVCRGWGAVASEGVERHVCWAGHVAALPAAANCWLRTSVLCSKTCDW